MRARLATPDDAVAIARIYNEAVLERAASFDTRPRSEADVRGWFDRAHPIVLVEDDARSAVGFAATAMYRPHEHYAGVSECSVFTARTHRRQGVGTLAMREIAGRAREAGSWKLVC